MAKFGSLVLVVFAGARANLQVIFCTDGARADLVKGNVTKKAFS